ncbi:inactive protein kinase SELMODRAFT_444075 [Vitis riparia]|uniref:inactive protein kinase SELMODRAFT_444075 n=1 Tax=Vitis riparia TaxID=96939 RepID=UPI00155A5BE5|nr:inactive protein kinase SELMODRAFT_444075 [Vitis riparia]XP_034695838.1 inactive protein kinase SELMODRAFT_444075 [Vitis riparia]XP_034695839.1 inactive protein kinase SELMODRAFT_444075 [Vitis riparia]XP_034695840.1 inactive protein kinase SELMODRAFT_444075 [Vitis riparia]
MSKEQKRGKQEKSSEAAEKVVVAVKASKEIPKTALVWALTHVVQPGDCITLLVVVPAQSPGRKLWGFPRFAGDCASGHRKSHSGASSEQKCEITDSCSQMILQLHDVYDPNKINVKIKIVSGSPCGAVSGEAKRTEANWVVLDKQLKHEEKCCMEELQCNIVVMKRSQPKVLRLNLVGSHKMESETACQLPSEPDETAEKHSKTKNDSMKSIRGPVVTPSSSPELGTPFTATEVGTSSVSSSDPGTSPFFNSEVNGDLKKEESSHTKENLDLDESSSDTDNENLSPSSSVGFQPWMAGVLASHHQSSQHIEQSSKKSRDKTQPPTSKALLDKFSKIDRDARIGMMNYRSELDFSGNVREAISLSRNAPPGPPPLCSICQHKAPVFGKPPRWFSYAELELATGGFSQANFLAEGGFGSVHRGVLPDGQAVAVKQHKLASSQGDVEFCSEVEVLSCAQHRNVVMLIGYCIEDRRRLLVYEYICNGSLDSHLYGRHRDPLEWSARQKVAVGAARGLRYLHEECRVGCIVHRDMRPNNILITHDFEPLVGDFGLARWQPDGDTGVETRVIGTFGYLAPEYAQSGQITEKADVYSFGVVLVELVTGRKAVDLNRPKGQQCLTEWARPLLEEYAIDELVDPRLGNCYSEQEVYCMLHAASLCIRRDPHARPRMSQVLRILEGDMVMDSNYMATPGYDVGSQSGRIWSDQHQHFSGPILNEAYEEFSGKLSLEALRSAFWEKDKGRRTSSEGKL